MLLEPPAAVHANGTAFLPPHSGTTALRPDFLAWPWSPPVMLSSKVHRCPDAGVKGPPTRDPRSRLQGDRSDGSISAVFPWEPLIL